MKNVSELLNAIRSGEILKSNSHSEFEKFGFESMVVDINAAPFYLARWELQEVVIPSDKKGNLKKYAGKTVEVICTTVQGGGGARINFKIREKK